MRWWITEGRSTVKYYQALHEVLNKLYPSLSLLWASGPVRAIFLFRSLRGLLFEHYAVLRVSTYDYSTQLSISGCCRDPRRTCLGYENRTQADLLPCMWMTSWQRCTKSSDTHNSKRSCALDHWCYCTNTQMMTRYHFFISVYCKSKWAWTLS